MNKKHLLEIGCEGGSISIHEVDLNGLLIFQLIIEEGFFDSAPIIKSFLSLNDAWIELTSKFNRWYILYPLLVHEYMFDLLKDAIDQKTDLGDDSYKNWSSILNRNNFPF